MQPLLAAPLVAEAQQTGKAARVGVLASSTEANFAPSVKAFREALKDLGWVEGRNLVLDIRYGGEEYGKLVDMAAELVRQKADVIAALPAEGEEGKFVERTVKLGPPAGDFVPVLDGLKPGDKVVTDGSFYLRAEATRTRSGG